MLDIVVLFMRVTNRTWPADDIVDVFPIGQDPGAGVAVNPKHAVMVVRNIPVDAGTFPKVKRLLTQTNYLNDDDPFSGTFDRNRWRFQVADLVASRRNAIRNQGRLDIDWADLKPVIIRKQQGAVDTRPIADGDLGG